MKTLRLLAAAAAALALAHPSATAAPAAPKTPTNVPLNGWYRCSASTLYGSHKAPHSDEYYLETKSHQGHHKRHKHRSANGPAQPAQTQRELRAPSVRVGEQRKATLPFLQKQQSLEWIAQEQSAAAAAFSAPSHHRAHGKNKRSWLGSMDLSPPQYECGAFRVPLCYDGICESNRTIDVFVKRVAAKKRSTASATKKPKALWVLQGGPGASSTAMESLMDELYHELDGDVSIYTMDHRGTARSYRLMCDAAQAGTTGSPSGTSIGVDEVPACIQDVLFQIDNQTAAFSVTSAAMDLKSVIDHHLSDHDVFVYGLSYGTYLVERLIHFAPTSVKGFSVDGIISEFGADADTRATYSNWDRDVGVVADRFLGYCLQDAFCKSKFPGVTDLSAFTHALYKKLDAAASDAPGTNACADALAASGTRPSYFLRTTFGDYLPSDEWRTTIPAIIYRAARCSREDADVLRLLADPVALSEAEDETEDIDNLLYTSEMLYNVIVFSEMWESPSPDKATLLRWYENATMASDNFYSLPYYCLFTGSKEKGCTELKHLPPSLPFVYKRDQYWNVPAKLPSHASALLLVGGLDVQTRRAYGAMEYKAIEGEKMLVDFKYASHCTTFTTPTQTGKGSCGMLVLASFVREDGVLSRVDTSCMADTYKLEFKDGESKAQELFGTRSLYG